MTTPVETCLDIWPPFPIAITYSPSHFVGLKFKDEKDIIAALEHRDRVSDIHIVDPKRSSLKRWLVAMQEPLPALTNFYLRYFSPPSLILPEAFLGGCAPCLQSFFLHGVAFPTFPKLVLRATHIVTLRLLDMPSSEYLSISSEVMATCLAALLDLETINRIRTTSIEPTSNGDAQHVPTDACSLSLPHGLSIRWYQRVPGRFRRPNRYTPTRPATNSVVHGLHL